MATQPSPIRSPFFKYRYHSQTEAFGGGPGLAAGANAPQRFGESPKDEEVGRYYLAQLFGQEPAGLPLQTLMAQEQPQILPDLQIRDVLPMTGMGTRLVRFGQAHESVPIYGSSAVVEIDGERRLISATAKLTEPPKIPMLAKISVTQALNRIAEYAEASSGQLEKEVNPPVQRLFHRRGTGRWYLTYLFSNVPAVPARIQAELKKIGVAGMQTSLSPRAVEVSYNYFVDTQTGEVLSYHSADPQLTSKEVILPPSVQLYGEDEDGVNRTMEGLYLESSEYEMTDPNRGIRTYDNKFATLDRQNPPKIPVRSNAPKISDAAAVSAHRNATLVWRFYQDVLNWRGVDGKGTELHSVVNCFHKPQWGAPKEWPNAAWWVGRMWYGRRKDKSGRLRSCARFLDVIGHELTHGVTRALVPNIEYLNETGALDESLSDIFGIIISNHALRERTSIQGWNWEVGAGWHEDGSALRDFENPGTRGQPEHMDDYIEGTPEEDNGRVHTNSGIHNKAAHNLMTAVDAGGELLFPPEELAKLYHDGTKLLGAQDGFEDMRDALETVAASRYRDPEYQAERIGQIRQAYQKVGIV